MAEEQAEEKSNLPILSSDGLALDHKESAHNDLFSKISDEEAEAKDNKDKDETFADISGLLKKYTPQTAAPGRKDAVSDRYFIKFDQPLPELDTELAKAYVAVDDANAEAELYALVMDRGLPYRLDEMRKLRDLEHPNLLKLVDYNTTELSQNDECCMVAVHERPKLKTVRQIMQERQSVFSERFIIDRVVAPLNRVLTMLAENGIFHGRINLDNVYLSDNRVVLGEAVSEPAGYSQHHVFESAERAQATALGKGESNIRTDCYALAVLALHLLRGLKVFANLEKHYHLNKRLTLGTYNTLVGAKECKSLEDFLKGCLSDDPAERWAPDQVEQWVKGKKYNLLTPSVLKESQRPFLFLSKEFYNRRALAHSFSQHWEEAQTLLRSNYLSRWIEVSLHKEDMAEMAMRVVERTGGVNAVGERANNELISRTLCLLDPEGPVYYNTESCFIDGLGPVLANAFRNKDQKQIQMVIDIIDHNFFGYADELLEGKKQQKHAQLFLRLQSCGRYLRMTAMGFGIERILYELNPNLPCQSPLLVNENVLTLNDMLGALDRVGARRPNGFDYLDRHIAAFVAAKLDIGKEIKIAELSKFPALAHNPQLIVLTMLAKAQVKGGRSKMKGLSGWGALKVLPLINNFHSRTIRQRMRKMLRSAARSGDLEKAFEPVLDARMIEEDYHGFRRSVVRYTTNAKKIRKASSRKRLRGRSENIGLILAMISSYSLFLVTLIVVLKDFIHL